MAQPLANINKKGVFDIQSVRDRKLKGEWNQTGERKCFVWGQNDYGKLGLNENNGHKSSPVQLPGTTWTNTAGAGMGWQGGVKSDGTLWNQGYAHYGNTGQNNRTTYSSPKQIGSGTYWMQVGTTGYNSTGAISKEGGMWTWGYMVGNGINALGSVNISSPTQVGGSDWYFLRNAYSAGESTQGLALKNDGRLFSWGYNTDYALGSQRAPGVNHRASSPIQVGNNGAYYANWTTEIAGGSDWSMAINNSNKLWGWGNNEQGQLGLNNKTDQQTPVMIPGNWKTVACVSGDTYYATLAIKTDGTLWAWGDNQKGQLGLNSKEEFSSPKQVGTDTNWALVAGNNRSSLATKTDGTLWSWGYNSMGQLGHNNLTEYSSPKQVGSETHWPTYRPYMEGDVSTLGPRGSWASSMNRGWSVLLAPEMD